MRQLPLATLAVLTLALPAIASEPQSGPLERREAVLSELGPVEQAWAGLREALADDGRAAADLAERLAPPLAGALLQGEAAVARGELSAHQAASGLGAVVLEAARAAGARPGQLSRLELVLREQLPRLVASSTLARPAGGEAGLAGDASGAEHADPRGRHCALAPADCDALGEALVRARMLEELRRHAAAALPGELALELRRAIAPGLPEALR